MPGGQGICSEVCHVAADYAFRLRSLNYGGQVGSNPYDNLATYVARNRFQ
jgi:hypothetical protein